MKRIVPLALLLVMLLVASHAAEYHVAQSNPAATDFGPGTAAVPFKTITAVLPRVMAGDVVTIHGGIYREALYLANLKGGPAQVTVIQAAPGEQVVLEGADAVTDWQPVGGKVWSAPWPYNFGEAPLPASWPESIWQFPMYRSEGAFVDGNPVSPMKSRDEMIPGSFVIDEANSRIYVWLLDGSSPLSHDVEVSVRGPLANFEWCTNLKLDGITARHARNVGAGIMLTNCTYSEIANCRAEWNVGSGIALNIKPNDGIGNRLINNVANFNGEMGISGKRFTGNLILNNETSYNNWHSALCGLFGWAYAGMKVVIFNNTRIEGHIAVNNLARGIWFDFDHTNNIIDRSLFHGNMDRGVYLEAGTGPNWVTNCLISGTRGLGHGITIANSPDQRIYHNTIVDNADLGIWIGGSAAPRGTTPNNSFATDADVRHNLFYNAGKTAAIALQRINYEKMTDYVTRTFRADGNRYYSDSHADDFVVNGERLAFDKWQTRGWDKLGVWGAPKLVDPARGDFRPVDGDTLAASPYVCPDEPVRDLAGIERKSHLVGAFTPVAAGTPLPTLADIGRYAPLDEMPLVLGGIGQLQRLAQVSQVRQAAPNVIFTATQQTWGDDIWVKIGQDGSKRMAMVVNPAPWSLDTTLAVPNWTVKDRVSGRQWNSPALSLKLTLAPYQVLVFDISSTGTVSATAKVSAAVHDQLSRQVEALQTKAAGNGELLKLCETAQADLKSGRHVTVWEALQSSAAKKAGADMNRLLDEGRL